MIERIVEAARLRAVRKLPWLSSPIFNLPVTFKAMRHLAGVTKDGVITFSTVNPTAKWWEKVWQGGKVEDKVRVADECAHVLAHECLHFVLKHSSRRGGRDPSLWNVACDIKVFELLRELLPAPEGAVKGEHFGLSRYFVEEATVEEIYERLLQLGERVKEFENEGSGVTGVEADWEGGIEERGVGELEGERIVNEVIDAMEKTRGALPFGLEREIGSLRRRGKIEKWRRLFSSVYSLARGRVLFGSEWKYPPRWVSWAIGMTEAGKIITSPTTFDMPEGVTLLPKLSQVTQPKVAVVIDTSGSMCGRDIRECLGEALTILQVSSELILISCDADVHDVKRVVKERDIPLTLHGGGGTDMRVGIEEALRHDPDIIVLFTDGYTPFPEKPPRKGIKPIPLIVVITPDGTTEDVPQWVSYLIRLGGE